MKKNKKSMFMMSLTIASVLVLGGTALAAPSNGDGMMNGMMNGNGMSKMMEEGMGDMMEAMNSPEGEEMIQGCQNFMSSYSDEENVQE